MIFTDQRSLMHITDQRMQTQWQLKMHTKLAGLQYKVVYKPDTSNLAADALSCHPNPPSQLQALSISTPAWLADVTAGYASGPESSKLLQELSINPQSHQPFTLQNGVIRYSGRIWVGNNHQLQQRIISALHDSALGGHSGFPVTYSCIKKLFCWRGMKQTIKAFVAACSVCHQAKPDRARYPGLLSPLPVPAEAWQMVSMDFIDGLPTSGHANCIMVVVDKLSKFAHFIPLHHPYTAQRVAQAFLDNIERIKMPKRGGELG